MLLTLISSEQHSIAMPARKAALRVRPGGVFGSCAASAFFFARRVEREGPQGPLTSWSRQSRR